MQVESEKDRQIAKLLESEKTQLEKNGIMLAEFGIELKRVGLNIADSYVFGSELGRVVVRMSEEGSKERDFLYDLGLNIIESLGNDDFFKDAKKYFQVVFPIGFTNKKDGLKIGE